MRKVIIMTNFTERTSYVNIDDALKRFMGNKKLYKKLLTSFSSDTNFGKLKTELDAAAYADAAASAHAIKGVCGNLSLAAMYEKSKDLEALLKDLAANNPGADPVSSGATSLYDAYEQARLISMIHIEQVINEIE